MKPPLTTEARKTPRTDEREVEAIEGLGRCVGVNFARELERENQVLTEALEEARGQIAELKEALSASTFASLKTHCAIENEKLRQLTSDSVIMVGRAGKILERMQEFWRHGTPIAAGSDLANEFTAWGESVMKGPLPSKETAQRPTP